MTVAGGKGNARRLAAMALAGCVACARPAVTAAPGRPAPPPRPVSEIAAAELRADLAVLAADSMRGRSALTGDATKAARFIARRLASLGVEPAGDSGYLQRVPLMRQMVEPGTRLEVTTPDGTVEMPFGERLIAVPTIGEGIPLPALSADGDVVFDGYVLPDADEGHASRPPLSLAGKTVVFLDDAPPGLSPEERAALDGPEMLGERLRALAGRGPAAIVVMFTARQADEFAAMAAELRSSGFAYGIPPAPDAPRPLPMLLFGLARAGSPLLPSGWPKDDRPQALPGHHFRGRLEIQSTAYPTYNVVGVVRGRDPSLRDSYVALGAHLDHLGIQPAVGGDSIANGADDDGSGSVALLAIARKVATSPIRPRRSMLFVWHTAEEEGLYGSEYFTSHPTVPLDSIVAQLNADMIGRNAPDSLYVVGPLAAPNGTSRVLGAIVDSVNAASPRPFHIDRTWDSPTHPEQMYYRSDHYSYAKRGIPIVFFTSGLHADYHRVSDDARKIDYDKLARVTSLIWHSGVAVANRGARPKPN